MDLKIKDVAELLNISESTIRRWLAEGRIPAYHLNNQYRFNRIEIENWVIKRKVGAQSTTTLTDTLKNESDNKKESYNNKGSNQYSLYRAVHKGGVLHNVPGETKEEVIQNAMKSIAKTLNLDADVIVELLLDREKLMPTALNNGIGVPHIRDSLSHVHHDAIAVVFPEKKINYGSLDGKAVHTLFFLFSCEDKRHLHLLAKIAHLSSQSEALQILQTQPTKEQFLLFLKKWERNIPISQE